MSEIMNSFWSWASPIGLGFFLIGSGIFLAGLGIFYWLISKNDNN